VFQRHQLVEDEHAENGEQGEHDKKNQEAGHDVLQNNLVAEIADGVRLT
jgi:hypothetical protein